MEKCRNHGLKLCSRCVVVSDAARRMSDTVNGVLTFHSRDWEIKDCWMAFRLSDGGSDGVVYDSRRAAIDHQVHETLCAYFSFRNVGSANPRDCQIFLDMHRAAYDAGMRLAEPEAPQLIVPTGYHDFLTGRNRG